MDEVWIGTRPHVATAETNKRGGLLLWNQSEGGVGVVARGGVGFGFACWVKWVFLFNCLKQTILKVFKQIET